MMRTLTMLSGGAIVATVGALAIVGLPLLTAAPPAAAPSAAAASTAEVVRGTLLDTKTVTGTLGYGELSALRPSLADASGMVTWLAPVGSTVERGEPLFAIDGQPTILFYGSVPQHRTLRFGPDAEPVWVELETARSGVAAAELTLDLEEARLADAELRASDTSARLDDALDAAPQTAEFLQLAGVIRSAEAKLARVTELSAAELAPAVDVAAAEAELAAARATFDAAIRGLRKDLSGARIDIATARVAVAEAEARLKDLRNALDALAARSPDDTDVAQLTDNLAVLGYGGTLPERLRAWQEAVGLAVTGIVGPAQVVIAEGSVHVAAHSASIGETMIESSPDRGSILDYSSIEKLVSVPLKVADQSLAALGREVTVTLPDNSDVVGTISEIGSVVTEGTIEVLVTIPDQVALQGLEVASVDVEFVSDGRDDVLSVPVAALLALTEGGFAVEVVDGTGTRIVPVKTGMFASGRVEVSGEDIAEGLRVGVPR